MKALVHSLDLIEKDIYPPKLVALARRLLIVLDQYRQSPNFVGLETLVAVEGSMELP